jgi:trehalose 6-phosphate phosphatase
MVSEIIADEAANIAAMNIFTRLDPARIALLFDVDGTLIDIARSPFEVDVPDALKASLKRLYELTDGALALISGRPIRDLDTLFAPLILPAVGGHGAEMRVSADSEVSRIADLPEAMRHQLVDAAKPGCGLEFEDKGYSVALHYRNAPSHEQRLAAHVEAVRAAFPDEDTEVLPGKAMFEVKRPGIDKGNGLRAVMRHKPFAGRQPVFVGDDVTDAAAFAVLAEFGGKEGGMDGDKGRGLGFGVGRHFPGVAGVFSSPAQVRDALRRLAGFGPPQP